MSCCGWFASPLAREAPKPTPSHLYIAYSSMFPFYADIIPHSYLLSAARDSLKWALLVADYSQHRCNMASVLSHHVGFDGTLTSLLRSIQRFLLFANVSWSISLIPIFHPLVHTTHPVLPDIPIMYPYFNYSYLPYQYLPTLTFIFLSTLNLLQ